MGKVVLSIAAAALLLSACAVFYSPKTDQPADPSRWGFTPTRSECTCDAAYPDLHRAPQ